jgi:putative DNA primase/helicase
MRNEVNRPLQVGEAADALDLSVHTVTAWIGQSQTPLPPRFSEEALALRFSRKYSDELRYVARWGHWMRWDGMRWVEDDTLHVFNLARGISRAASAECGDAEKALAARLASKTTSVAVELLARADRCHAATVEQWDSDNWLLNTPEGTVDLRSGEIHEHRREEYLTRLTAAGPGGDCTHWLEFLERVTDGDPELQSFFQRMVGYALTGSTREHALFFLYGTGANGKSVFLSTVSAVLGDYAKTAPATSFIASTTEQHPTDLAGLRGARLVTAIETEDGARWAESKIKSLTGGDKVSARFMRCDFFEFVPEFKLVIAGNHKPGLRSVDEAIRRRLHLVPFTITIPENERDPGLAEKLRAEYPAILRWAIEGCLAWQREGLKPPTAVRDATDDYLSGEDAIGRWIEEHCVTDDRAWTATGVLFADYQTWCKQTGEREGSQKRFAQQLEAGGFQRQRTNRAKGFIGVALREDVVPHVPRSPIFPVSHAHPRTPLIGQSGTSGTDEGNPDSGPLFVREFGEREQ